MAQQRDVLLRGAHKHDALEVAHVFPGAHGLYLLEHVHLLLHDLAHAHHHADNTRLQSQANNGELETEYIAKKTNKIVSVSQHSIIMLTILVCDGDKLTGN